VFPLHFIFTPNIIIYNIYPPSLSRIIPGRPNADKKSRPFRKIIDQQDTHSRKNTTPHQNVTP
jgi:hypothetical protein